MGKNTILATSTLAALLSGSESLGQEYPPKITPNGFEKTYDAQGKPKIVAKLRADIGDSPTPAKLKDAANEFTTSPEVVGKVGGFCKGTDPEWRKFAKQKGARPDGVVLDVTATVDGKRATAQIKFGCRGATR